MVNPYPVRVERAGHRSVHENFAGLPTFPIAGADVSRVQQPHVGQGGPSKDSGLESFYCSSPIQERAEFMLEFNSVGVPSPDGIAGESIKFSVLSTPIAGQ